MADQRGNVVAIGGNNHGPITINYNGKEIKRFLTPHPFDPPLFIGRKEGLKAVRDKLFGGQIFLMLVNGQGGIGKTSFAAKYWKEYQDEYAHLAFLFVENGIGDALLGLADGLGAEFPPEMPQEQCLEVLAKHIAGLNKPCLLVLDNANNETELNAHALLLRRFGNFHILITSRLADFEQAEKHAIGALDKKDALTVFRTHYKAFEESETELFYEIFEAIGGNTLLVELFAKNIDHFNNKLRKRYSLQNLLDDLQKGLTKLSQSKEVNTAYQAKGAGLRTESIESIVLAMYDLTELDDSEKAILSVFAVLPAENIAFEVLENFLKLENLDQKLIDLAKKGWIDYEDNSSSFKCNPVVQEITRHQNQNRLFEDCEVMIDFLNEELGYEDNHLKRSSYPQAAIYSRYCEKMLDYFKSHSKTGTLFERIGNFYKLTGKYYKSLIFFKKCSKIFENILHKNINSDFYKNNLAISYGKEASIYFFIDNLDESLKLYKKSNELIIEINQKKYHYSLQISYEKIGTILRKIYRRDGALDILDEALRAYKKQYQLVTQLCKEFPENLSYKKALASNYSCLGKTYEMFEDLNMALYQFLKYNEISKQLYKSDCNNTSFKHHLAASNEQLGLTYFGLGEYKLALDYFIENLRLINELNEVSPANIGIRHDLANAHVHLSRSYFEINNMEKAKSHIQEAYYRFNELAIDCPGNRDFINSANIAKNALSNL